MSKRRRGTTNISDLEYLTLGALSPTALYGYAIRRDITERTEGQLKPSLATLYDILRRLLEDDLIVRAEDEVIDGRLRRTYRITALGEQVMADKERIVALLHPRILVNES